MKFVLGIVRNTAQNIRIRRTGCRLFLVLMTFLITYRLLGINRSNNYFFFDNGGSAPSNNGFTLLCQTSLLYQVISNKTCQGSDSKTSRCVNIVRATETEQTLMVTAGFKLVPGNRFVSCPSISAKGIPKIIHQTWKEQETVPSVFRNWMSTWPIQLARDDWEYWFWTDNDMHRFVAVYFPQYLELYDSYPSGIYRADVFRYMLLSKYGGVYADLDIDCLKSINPLVDQWECVFAQEPIEHAHFLWDMTPPLLSSAFMACRPSHDIFTSVLSSLQGRLPHCLQTGNRSIIGCTGPLMLTDIYSIHKNQNRSADIEILDADLFHPLMKANKYLVKCKNKDIQLKRPELHDMLCQRLRAPNYSKHQLTEAYTQHHWSNIYVSINKGLLISYFDVSELSEDININSPENMMPGTLGLTNPFSSREVLEKFFEGHGFGFGLELSDLEGLNFGYEGSDLGLER